MISSIKTSLKLRAPESRDGPYYEKEDDKWRQQKLETEREPRVKLLGTLPLKFRHAYPKPDDDLYQRATLETKKKKMEIIKYQNTINK